MLNYEFRKIDDATAAQLIALSGVWVEEDCSYGMVVNERDDLKEPLAVALDGEKIVGYIFGHYYKQESKTSCMDIGTDCFAVDELYVLPQYRSQGIGRTLFKILEENVKGKCSYMTLATSTKNWKAILKLYIEELGMNFHSAFLFKNMEEAI